MDLTHQANEEERWVNVPSLDEFIKPNQWEVGLIANLTNQLFLQNWDAPISYPE